MKKKVDKKTAFVLTFLLVAGILLIYAKLSFVPTGLIVDENLYTCGNWTDCVDSNQTRECISNTNSSDIIIDVQDCEIACTEDWICEDWTDCVNGTQTRTCEDANDCGTEEDKPEESQECGVCGNGEIEVNEECDDGEQNSDTIVDACRTDCKIAYCGDELIDTGEECDNGINNTDTSCTADYESSCTYCDTSCISYTVSGGSCGDGVCDSEEGCNCEYDCDSCEDGYTCNDEGVCEEEEEETSEETSSSSSESESSSSLELTSEAVSTTCSPNWECSEWAECVDGMQDRICTDINQCGSSEGMPVTSQSCVVEIKETCSDGIKNQDEKGIDCGGTCEKNCGFFTIVGSAISVPVDAGKNFVLKGMFGSTGKTVISIISLVLIIGGAVVFVLFKKNILKVSLLKKLFQKKDFGNRPF